MTSSDSPRPHEAPPATGLEIAQTLEDGRSLTDRMARTHAAMFDGNATVQALYLDLYAELIAEAETVPGYGTAMAMLLERFAFLWAAQKANDLLDTPLNPRDYETLLLRFRQLWDGLLRARDDRQADAQFKASFVTACMSVISDVCTELLDPETALALQQRMVQRMRAIEVQTTDQRR